LDASRLKSIPLFQDVPDDELAQIAGFAQEVNVEAGRELVREGDFSYEFMLIEEGEAQVTRHGDHVNDLGPGDFFGEMGLVGDTRRNANVIASSPLKVVVMTAQAFRQTSRELPEVAAKIRAAIEERCRHLEVAG
jgi:CRP/FNR family transcriptional regulator, cyclic AMP receptor protein